MRKWRPTYVCTYVIPEIHGNSKSLEIIFNRILPLRKFENQQDRIIFLGDYIDYGDNSNEVLNLLLTIKNEYNDRIVFLRGNHEELLLRALSNKNNTDYLTWLNSGGIQTINSYLYPKKYSVPQSRLVDIIPKEHVQFLESTVYYHKHENYFLMHASFDHLKKIEDNAKENFIFDNTACKYVKESVRLKTNLLFKDPYIFVGSHNPGSKIPFIHPQYFMLGGSAPQQILLFELNSMSACFIKASKSRIYKYNFKYHE